LPVKSQILPYVCLLFWKHNGLYNRAWCFKTKNSECAPQWLIIRKPISQYISYAAMFCPLHSSISIKQLKKHLCNPSSHYAKCGRFTREAPPHISMHESHNVLISAILNSFHNIIAVKKCLSDIFVSHWSHYTLTANCHLTRLWKRMVAQTGTKVAPWCKHCSCCGWWKGTSWDEVTLINEKSSI